MKDGLNKPPNLQEITDLAQRSVKKACKRFGLYLSEVMHICRRGQEVMCRCPGLVQSSGPLHFLLMVRHNKLTVTYAEKLAAILIHGLAPRKNREGL